MKLKVNNNIIKESNNMEERNETVGLKVKDVRTVKEEEPIVTPEEDPITDEQVNEVEEDPIPVPVEPGPVIIPDPVEEDPIEEEPETEKDGFEKIACARLFSEKGTTVFRFDVFYKEYAENSGTIEYRNIIDNFNAVRPTKSSELKEFFAMFGIIRWNFSTTLLPVNTNVLEALLKIECLINEQILSAGIKKGRYEFRVETAED